MIDAAVQMLLVKLTNPINILVALISLSLSVLFYVLFKRTDNIKVKVTYLYSHIFLLFFPFLFSAFLSKCTATMYSCIRECATPLYVCSPELLVYLTTAGIVTAFLLSFLTLPYLYTWANKSHQVTSGPIQEILEKHSPALDLRLPKIYTINDLRPIAYSITNIRPSIFLSVGLCELLSEKELEAVLLHELYHIKHKTSFWRFSTHILKIFSPLSTFITLDKSINLEEQDADSFAIRMQGISCFLDSAKQKINLMNKKIREYPG